MMTRSMQVVLYFAAGALRYRASRFVWRKDLPHSRERRLPQLP
jgi:hypothetical protein